MNLIPTLYYVPRKVSITSDLVRSPSTMKPEELCLMTSSSAGVLFVTMTVLQALLLVHVLALSYANSQPGLEQQEPLGNEVSDPGANGKSLAKVTSGVIEDIEATVPTTTITSPAQALSALSTIFATATNFRDSAPAFVAAGFVSNDIEDIVEGYSPAQNSVNTNPPPPCNIYPASPSDSPHSLPDSARAPGYASHQSSHTATSLPSSSCPAAKVDIMTASRTRLPLLGPQSFRHKILASASTFFFSHLSSLSIPSNKNEHTANPYDTLILEKKLWMCRPEFVPSTWIYYE